MNYFKAAEQVLASVPVLKKALENMQKREQRLIDSGKPRTPGSMDYSKPFTDTHFVNDTLNDFLELSEVTQNIAYTKQAIKEIEDVINQLPAEQSKLITLWYIDKHSKETIAEEMFIESLTTVYNIRNRAVAEFALRYYGAAALPSI